MTLRTFLSILGIATWLFSGCSLRTNDSNIKSNATIDALLKKVESNPEFTSDSSLFFTRRALILSRELGYHYGLARSSHLLGAVFYKIGNLDLSIKHLHESIHAYNQINDQLHLAETNSLIGQVYLRSENYNQGLIHLRRARSLYNLQNLDSGEAHVFGLIGHLYEKSKQYDSALFYQQKALEYFSTYVDSTELAVIYDNIGSIYEDLEAFDEAYVNFKKAYDYNRALSNTSEAIINLNNIGDTYRKRNQLSTALRYTRQAYNEAKLLQNDYQIQSAARDLAKNYLASEQYDSAYHYLNQSYELNEVIFGKEIAKEIANAQTIFDLEQKQQTISLLEKERASNRQITIIGFGASAILIILIVYGSGQRGAKNRKERKLLKTENELSKAELINAQLNEEKLKTELENKHLEESKLQLELELKNKSLSRSALQIIQKNEFLESLRSNLKKIKKSEKEDIHQKIRKLTRSIDLNFNLDEDWEEFENIFQQIHTGFFDRIRKNHPGLTNSEVRLCAMIHANLHSHEIASIMNISNDSLRIARYRLRKKLGLEKGENLYAYITNLG
ncbi:tetratricopeptide repeat protein [Reichenbachiella carrageenanivorans]|uniref:Tetratricopeptide repeat protein n=1 Tax=Reichenbachiella carrageenanivorans TaxID=2979869 RepID=A0ABY6CUS7_9BACT|nr:tetratricopeptide repeat protein [Reichenbachiella carrageenanivorans]UXX77676.1 tetratricopeptide repeat protein [Reichenbachiella carrageenanivorans]